MSQARDYRGPASLPVDRALPDVVRALRAHGAAVLTAPPGSGKTLRTPPALLKAGLLGDGRLLMLQPRRVAARACAHTMARWMGESAGETVGYHIRFDRRASAKTRILVMTEGVLTSRFAGDPLLDGVSCVILDEFHERSIHTDLGLAFLKELRAVRENLSILVMSATLAAEPVAAYLDDAPVIRVEARTHPLTVDYRSLPADAELGARVQAGLERLLDDPADDGGHILAFLPGAPEIRRVQRHLEKRDWGLELAPLYGALSPAEQDRALAPSARRRLILATNIAETSLTIEGVTAVIDSGLHKRAIHDPNRGVDRLDTLRISRASADQRAGRAGRTAPGRVVRLWSEDWQAMMPEQDPPEIAIADLAGPLLRVLDFHGPDLNAFPFFERPPQAALDQALAVLRMLGAVGGDGRIAERGRRLVNLPLHPRIGRIFERAAELGQLQEAALACAILNERPFARTNLSLFEQIQALRQYAEGRGTDALDRRAAKRALEAERQLLRQAKRLWPNARKEAAAMSRAALADLLLSGYPDRLCVARASGQGVMVGGRGVAFEPFKSPDGAGLFLALEVAERGRKRTAGHVDLLCPVTLDQARSALPLATEETAVWDVARDAAAGVRRVVWQDLVLVETGGVNVAGEALAACLAENAAARFDVFFKPDKAAAGLLQRLRFAAVHLPEEPWPDVSDDGLKALLPELCIGKRKLDELRRLDWSSALLSRLAWRQRNLLDQEVPETVEVPSGSRIRIDYAPAFEAAGQPVLAARMQELFGMTDTPRVARGRVPLLLHLLAPNMRPAQVTQDLRSFWNGTYAEVRKELRQRYPKHYWPEDPWTAQATRRVRPK